MFTVFIVTEKPRNWECQLKNPIHPLCIARFNYCYDPSLAPYLVSNLSQVTRPDRRVLFSSIMAEMELSDVEGELNYIGGFELAIRVK